VDERFLHIKPNIILLTHDHLDHTDHETLCHYLGDDTEVTVLASGNAWQLVRKAFGGLKNNYVSFNRGTEWTERNIRFRAVCAEHSDDCAIGVIIEAENKTYYVTGDTLYNAKIFADLPQKIDAVFLPVNGVGNNMNMTDAARFAKKIGAKKVVPIHFGMFDELTARDFPCENKVIPELFKEVLR
jgi:L-ascorbate metabolism protein UlaG (beta-lactamase superfamily)